MIKYICEGCGKESPPKFRKGPPQAPVLYDKPEGWLERPHKGEVLTVCCTECALKVNTKIGVEAPIT